jgi:hypothetical protein
MQTCAKLTLCLAVIVCLVGGAFAQTQDPLIGTWNISGANSDGTSPFIAVMTFNSGGTTVEFDTSGTNSSASPGESITLGKWAPTANLSYKYNEENYIYDASGDLSLIAIAACHATLASSLKSFSGKCNVNFYSCSVSLCPGSLVVGPVAVNVKGRRF